MQNFAGLDRGATPAPVYHSARVLEAPLTRLGIDAQTTQQWRGKGFHPVLNERNQTPQNNLAASVLYNMLALKARNPLPEGVLPEGMFDFSVGTRAVVSDARSDAEVRERPSSVGHAVRIAGADIGGNAQRYRLALGWVPRLDCRRRCPKPYQRSVERWEAFFNGPSLKEQLMSRYMYEHLFLADIYFDEIGTGEHFRMVRSTTPPGEPIDIIATRRPYDDPGVARPYYRLQRNTETLVSKTHMAYALNAERMTRWQGLFLMPPYSVDRLADYKAVDASNPFVTFQRDTRQEPISIHDRRGAVHDHGIHQGSGVSRPDRARRHRGPVLGLVHRSRGRSDDARWRVPRLATEGTRIACVRRQRQSAAAALAPLLEDREGVPRCESRARNGDVSERPALTLDMIWDGGGVNQNAALTVFRHFDSATVVKGLVGEDPKTAWVIDYPLLERIHYLLVAGYDVYGNAGEQLFSRLYMDFLRIGGEFNFLYFLPPQARTAAIDNWYRGAESNIAKYLADYQQLYGHATGIDYAGDDPKAELYAHLKSRVGPVLSTYYQMDRSTLPAELRTDLARLAETSGVPVSWMPELSMMTIDTGAGPENRSRWCTTTATRTSRPCSTRRPAAFRRKTH